MLGLYRVKSSLGWFKLG